MDRKLDIYPIPQAVFAKLSRSGFTTVNDLQNIGPSQLAKETGLTEIEALDVFDTIAGTKAGTSSCKLPGTSALELFVDENSKPPIPTFCQRLDEILGGGIPLMKLTELCGGPGTGKTQICLQLCTTVQVPEACGGLDGEAIFIDTEGSFVVDRLLQIACATADACQKISKASNAEVKSFTAQKILEGVFYFRCKDFSELVACVNILDEFIEQHPKISLLVIDSISFHCRYGFQERFATRSKLLFGLSQTLINLANQFKLAVVLTNQMTHKMDDESQFALVPTLGESWGHACTLRVILTLSEAKREAYLCKSPWKAESTALYKIEAKGVRDHSVPNVASTSFQPNKKLKT